MSSLYLQTSTNAVHKGEQFLKRSPQQLIDQHGDEDEVFACFMMVRYFVY